MTKSLSVARCAGSAVNSSMAAKESRRPLPITSDTACHGVLAKTSSSVCRPLQGTCRYCSPTGGKGFADVLRVPARYEGHGAEDAGNRRSAGAYTEHLADERLKPGVVLLHVVELRVDAGLIEVRGVERALFGPDGIFEIQLRNLLFNAHRDNRAAELFPDGGKVRPAARRKKRPCPRRRAACRRARRPRH